MSGEGAGLSPRGRLAWLDVARGVALVAMAVYHFVWDLALFGIVPPITPFEPHWVGLARVTAATFLVLVGIGLALGHGRGIQWQPFWRRFAMIAGAAGLITAGTLFAMPDAFIFFGILHMIAVGSLAGLLLVTRPAFISVIVAFIVAVIGFTVSAPLFDEPALWWTGLGTRTIPSNDFVPFFPAFSAVAVGIAIAKIVPLNGMGSEGERNRSSNALSRTLAFAGRHSLAVYLLHQPILIGTLWLFVQAFGTG